MRPNTVSPRTHVYDQLTKGALQWSPASGEIDLGPGYPGPELWPTQLVSDAAVALFDEAPATALLYGAERGPEALRRAVAERISLRPPVEEVMITAGTSAALDELCLVVTRPGDVVLVEDTTYDLARSIFRDHELVMQPVVTDACGIDLEDLAACLAARRASGERVCFAYLIPTHHNPTGKTYDLARRHALVALATDASLTIVEDDAYESLWFDVPPPPSLRSLDDSENVIRLGTFSKTLGPGMRVGWLEGPRNLVDTLTSRGVRRSGGGSSQLAAMLVAGVLSTGGYEHHVSELRNRLRLRWQAIEDTLAVDTTDYNCNRPAGGYFAWIRIPDGIPPSAVVIDARKRGVIVRDGRDFGAAGCGHVRVSLSYYGENDLRAAVQRLIQVPDLEGTVVCP